MSGRKPLCIDLFCGLGGWTEGFLAEGFGVVGFDIEQHVYGEHRSQFKDADIIVASSPCQEFSYRAMPWKRAKALGPPVLGMELFAQAGRIQREACAASGRYIPMIQENVPRCPTVGWQGGVALWLSSDGNTGASRKPTKKPLRRSQRFPSLWLSGSPA